MPRGGLESFAGCLKSGDCSLRPGCAVGLHAGDDAVYSFYQESSMQETDLTRQIGKSRHKA
jgi:hypothetical protein